MPTRKTTGLSKREIVSAQVVLRAASGKPIQRATITSENLADYLPSPRSTAGVTQTFAGAGFEVGPLVGISFTITASVGTFETVFETRLRVDERGAVMAVKTDGATSPELPLRALPEAVVRYIEAVSFSRPLDFGPTKSGPWS